VWYRPASISDRTRFIQEKQESAGEKESNGGEGKLSLGGARETREKGTYHLWTGIGRGGMIKVRNGNTSRENGQRVQLGWAAKVVKYSHSGGNPTLVGKKKKEKGELIRNPRPWWEKKPDGIRPLLAQGGCKGQRKKHRLDIPKETHRR